MQKRKHTNRPRKYELMFWDVEDGEWALVRKYNTYAEAAAGERRQIAKGTDEDQLSIFFGGRLLRPGG